MDGGSGLNLIFATTLRAMNISLTNLEATNTSFHGIVPGKPEVPLGKIGLDVIFGMQENYRRERIKFEVVDWPSQYHAILRQPAFARFMAVSHYAYLMVKMTWPRGTITVRGSFTRSDNYDKDFNKIWEFFGMQQELSSIRETTNYNVLPDARKEAPEVEFDTSSDTRVHQVHPTDPSKTALVSKDLTPK